MSTGYDVHTEAFECFPNGIVVVDESSGVVAVNARAKDLLGDVAANATCCSLLGCRAASSPLGDNCFSDMAREKGEALPEVRVDLGSGRPADALWVTASPLSEGRAIIELRRGETGDRRRRTTPHWVTGPRLFVHALGRTRVESAEGPLQGRWLERRAGQLLKYLVSERSRVVYVDEIADNLWPDANVSAVSNVRYFVHILRQQIEPDRPKRGASPFIVSVQGGYSLNQERVWVDVDSFERDADAGLAAFRAGNPEEGERLLLRAVDRYQGDFLEDEPYAQWALPERDRLRAKASDVLDALVRARIGAGDFEGGGALMDRLASMQPYDMTVQRRRIALSLGRGRRSDAVRQYDALRARMQKTFGERPSFALADVSPRDAAR